MVTGGDGFLGATVVRMLRGTYSEVLSLMRPANGDTGSVFCDLAVPSSVCCLLSNQAPDRIVNLAATVDFSPRVLPQLYPVNSLSPAIMAEYCQRAGAVFVQASGVVVLGFRNVHLGSETLECPDTDYGRSKLIVDYAILASGCAATIIRFGNYLATTVRNTLA